MTSPSPRPIPSVHEFALQVTTLIGVEVEGAANPYDSLYEDWGMDSLQAFQLIVVIEALAGLNVPPIEIPELFTVQDAYDYYRTAVSLAEA